MAQVRTTWVEEPALGHFVIQGKLADVPGLVMIHHNFEKALLEMRFCLEGHDPTEVCVDADMYAQNVRDYLKSAVGLGLAAQASQISVTELSE